MILHIGYMNICTVYLYICHTNAFVYDISSSVIWSAAPFGFGSGMEMNAVAASHSCC